MRPESGCFAAEAVLAPIGQERAIALARWLVQAFETVQNAENQSGLTTRQLWLLSCIAADPGHSVREYQKRFGSRRNTFVVNIATLAKADLVVCRGRTDDGSPMRLEPTEAGLSLLVPLVTEMRREVALNGVTREALDAVA
jgi:DNA-binding MarR family transcriptional regulator